MPALREAPRNALSLDVQLHECVLSSGVCALRSWVARVGRKLTVLCVMRTSLSGCISCLSASCVDGRQATAPLLHSHRWGRPCGALAVAAGGRGRAG